MSEISRILQQFSGVTMPSHRFDDAAEAVRIKAKAEILMHIWEIRCQLWPRGEIISIEPKPFVKLHPLNRYKDLYGIERVKFYTIHIGHDLVTPWKPRYKPKDKAMKQVLEGAKFYNTCWDSCLVLSELASAIFEGDEYIKSVEWKDFLPYPEIVLNYAPPYAFLNQNGAEEPFAHDILTLHSRNDKEYVIDVTGKQFGYKDWFVNMAQYKFRFNPARPVKTKVPAEVFNGTKKHSEETIHYQDVLFLKNLVADCFEYSKYKKATQAKEERKALDACLMLFRAGILDALRSWKTSDANDTKNYNIRCFPPAYEAWAEGFFQGQDSLKQRFVRKIQDWLQTVRRRFSDAE